MSNTPSDAVALFGTEEPVPDCPQLRAGALTASLDAGNLRHIKLNGVEAIRAIQYLSRNKNWGTYSPDIANLKIDQGDDSFVVTYDAVCRDAEQELAYSARIEGRADGSLAFDVTATPKGEYLTARTGFVVLHPSDVSGQPVKVGQVDGTSTVATFPVEIDPAQPFKNMRALTHEVTPGVNVTCTMLGDTFEMEDQRNWMDASYKTYVRPLALPWPYTLPGGEAFEQSVTLAVTGPVSSQAAGDAEGAVTVTVGGETESTVPSLGLYIPPELSRDARGLSDALGALKPNYLVGRFDAREGHNSVTLRNYEAVKRAIGKPFTLEAILPCLDGNGQPSDEVAIMKDDMAFLVGCCEEADLEPDAVVVTPSTDTKCTLPDDVFPPSPPLAEIYDAARAAFPNAQIGGGMVSYFTELNRKRPPTDKLDFITHTLCPIIHACDDISVMENLEALPHIATSVRALGGGLPYRIGPTAIGMRDNPYGAAAADNPDNIRIAMAINDPRQRSLLGASWYAGLFARMTAGGAEAICLATLSGPNGLVHTDQDWPTPWFGDQPADTLLYPAFHVIAEINRVAGRAVYETASSVPGAVQAFAYTSSTGPRIWLANLTGTAQSVQVEGVDRSARAHIHMIDASTFTDVCTDLGGFDYATRPVEDGRVELAPYACGRLDVLSG